MTNLFCSYSYYFVFILKKDWKHRHPKVIELAFSLVFLFSLLFWGFPACWEQWEMVTHKDWDGDVTMNNGDLWKNGQIQSQVWRLEAETLHTWYVCCFVVYLWRFPKIEVSKNGWYSKWKIPSKYGWWLGVPLWLRKPPYDVVLHSPGLPSSLGYPPVSSVSPAAHIGTPQVTWLPPSGPEEIPQVMCLTRDPIDTEKKRTKMDGHLPEAFKQSGTWYTWSWHMEDFLMVKTCRN